jgi:hypothetical protein
MNQKNNMNPQDKSRLKIINASGYLFQLKIEDEIRNLKTYTDNNIKIIASEHRWVDIDTSDEGFIDTIIENGIFRYVIETKRVQDAEWIFLVPRNSNPTQDTRLLFARINVSNNKYYQDWAKVIIRPLTIRSSFCLIRGQGESKLSMLERIGETLLRSVESLAVEELYIPYESTRDRSFVYLPIIITNAKLLISEYDPNDVDLMTGKINEASFNETPFIQFYKNMSSSLKTDSKPHNLHEANLQNNRSVIIVNSDKIAEFIDNIQIPGNAPQPWNLF